MLHLPLVHRYNSLRPDITVPVTLIAGSFEIELVAKIDTGSTYCIFGHEHGEELRLNVEEGEPMRMQTLNGSFTIYGHELTLRVLDIEHTAVVYFYADPNFGRNVLGRRGGLDRVRLGIVDHDCELYLAPYNE